MRNEAFLILNPQAELSEAIKAGLLVICRIKFPPRKIASFKDFLRKSDGMSYLYFKRYINAKSASQTLNPKIELCPIFGRKIRLRKL